MSEPHLLGGNIGLPGNNGGGGGGEGEEGESVKEKVHRWTVSQP